MKYNLKRISYLIILLLSIIFIIFISNQILSMYSTLNSINPVFGKTLIYSLSVILLASIIFFMIHYKKFSKQIILPKDKNSEEYNTKMKALVKELKKNKNIEEKVDYDDQNESEWVLKCIDKLDEQAKKVIEENAEYAFLSTAVSQNGIFDSILILMALIKMIWQILHIYYQRPNLKFILYLYLNIVITVFTVKAIEDFDYIEKQIEPIVASILGSSITPGVNMVALLLINSLISGTANTFLVLRVGLIAQKYSSPIVNKEKNRLRKDATIEASKLLGKVISGSIVLLSKSIGKASVNATKNIGKSGKNKAKEFGENVKEVTKTIVNTVKDKFN